MYSEKILIIEDEKEIGDLLIFQLNKEGYHQILHLLSGKNAVEEIKKYKPNLIFLDIMLPGMNGLDICRYLKANAETASIPIIMLSAHSDESDIIVGLEIGADDYITKPFSNKLLIARMRSVLRRSERAAESKSEPNILLKCGPIQINQMTRQVWVQGELVPFTVSEFNLLHLLASHQDQVFTREQLVQELRGDDYPVMERAMDVLVLGVRRKLKAYSNWIETIRGIGYRFSENPLY